MRKRRYEILLPLKHNDGRPVDGALFEQTREDLVSKFRAVTILPHTVVGVWTHESERYEDELLRFVADVDDATDNEQYFSEFKGVLLERFQQIEIYISSYPADIL